MRHTDGIHGNGAAVHLHDLVARALDEVPVMGHQHDRQRFRGGVQEVHQVLDPSQTPFVDGEASWNIHQLLDEGSFKRSKDPKY